MVLLSFKHLIFTKKSILIGLLSLCVIVTGCDKKSERRRTGKKTPGETELIAKTDPKLAKQDDQPCMPPQVNAPVPPGQNNNQGANAQNPQGVAATVDPHAPKPATTTPNAKNGPVPCLPGQQPQKPGVPLEANNSGSTSAQQDGSDTQTPVLVGNESPDKNNNSGSTSQNNKGTGNSGSQSKPNALPNLDLKDSSAHNDEEESARHDKGGEASDEEGNDSDTKDQKSKYTKQVKQLLDILEQLDIYYKNAVWTITQDRYYTPNNFFSLLKSRLGKRINTKNLLIKVGNDYIDESRDHSCAGTAFELQIDTESETQKLFVYDCRDERLVDENSPVLTFKKNKRSWLIESSIHGLQQITGDEALGYLITISNDKKTNPIIMEPKCRIKTIEENEETVKVKSADCKYWGQQLTSRENGKETFLFEEFTYDSEGDNELSVKARSLNMNEENQLCYENQINTLAKKYDSHIHIMDGKDEKGAGCTKANKDLTKNGNKVAQPQAQGLVAAQPQTNNPNVTIEQQLVPQMLHAVQSQQANPFHQANQLSPMEQANQSHQPYENQDQRHELVNGAPIDAAPPSGYEADPYALSNNNVNDTQMIDPNGNQNMIVGDDGVERPDTTVEVNPNQQAPPVVYRQPRVNQQNLNNQQNRGRVVPPVNQNYYEGQQMDFSSEAPLRQSR